MKNYSYLTILLLMVLLAHSGALSAGSYRKSTWSNSKPTEMVAAVAAQFRIYDPVHKDLLFAATQKDSDMILSFERNPHLWGNPYPSHVLRAAQDLALKTGNMRVHHVLERMLSYK